ncbi:MAG: bacteriohemerythrin [Anaeromyxobacteraceae bacterium]
MSTIPDRRALVVDDSLAARTAAAHLIEPLGFDVDLAEDGGAALRLLEHDGTYDLALVDIQMPSLDGHELVRMMRARGNFTPVVVTTGAVGTRQVAAVLKVGANDFLTKPIDPVQLHQAVARALNLAPDTLRPETPRVLVAGDAALLATVREHLPPYVELDRVEPGEVDPALLRAAYRAAVVRLGEPRSSSRREEAEAIASRTAEALRATQPEAGRFLVTPDAAPDLGYDQALPESTLAEALRTCVFPGAVRPLVLSDDALIRVASFRGAPSSERAYFEVVLRRLRSTIAQLGPTPSLVVDLSRVPARTAEVERLATEVVGSFEGNDDGPVIWVPIALVPSIQRLALRARIRPPGLVRAPRALFRWTPDLATGIQAIDEEHQELFRRVEGLLVASRSGRGHQELTAAFEFLEQYTAHHLAEEEALMKQSGYPELGAHVGEHWEFSAQLRAFAAEHAREHYSDDLAARVGRSLSEWIYRHVRRTDRALGRFLARGGKPPETER